MALNMEKVIRWLSANGAAALLTAALSTAGSFLISDLQDSRSQSRAAANEAAAKLREKQLEALINFSGEDDGMLSASRAYIKAVLAKKSLKQPADELSEQIKKQIISAEKLKTLFTGADVESKITSYQNALLAFAHSIDGFKSETTASIWSGNFENVANTKIDLRASLKKSLSNGA